MRDTKPTDVRVKNIGFEIYTPVITKSSIFWDVTPCSPLKIDVSEEHVCIFRVETQRETGSKQPIENQPTFGRIMSPPSSPFSRP
jgi:hypothetical protein